jgi:hypothetical protein
MRPGVASESVSAHGVPRVACVCSIVRGQSSGSRRIGSYGVTCFGEVRP